MRTRTPLAAAGVLLWLVGLCAAAEPNAVPPGCWPAAKAERIEKALDAWFSADANDRAGLYSRVLAKQPIGLSREALARIAAARGPEGTKGPAGTTRVSLPWDPNNPRGWANIRLPDNYTPTRAWPLAICLHGSGADGDNVTSFYSPQLNNDGFITIYPTTTDKQHMWSTGAEVANVYRLLSWAGRRWRVDYRRLVVTGGSMGGMGTWSHLLSAPHLWAAGGSVAGHPAAMKGGILENLRHTPLYVLHGEKDTDGASLAPVEHVRAAVAELKRRKIPHVYVEAPDAGHTPPRKYWRAMNRWIANQKPQPHSPRPLFLPADGNRAIWQMQLDPLGLAGQDDPAWKLIQAGKSAEAIANLNRRTAGGEDSARVHLLRAVARVPGLVGEYPWSLDPDSFAGSDGWSARSEAIALKDLRAALKTKKGKGALPKFFDAAVYVMMAKIHARRFTSLVDERGIAWVRHYNAAVASVRSALTSKPGYREAARLVAALKSRLPDLPRRNR